MAMYKYGKLRVQNPVRISTIIILSFLVTFFISSCSDSRSYKQGPSLWDKRQMDDDQRIYGNPYETRDRRESRGEWEGFRENID